MAAYFNQLKIKYANKIGAGMSFGFQIRYVTNVVLQQQTFLQDMLRMTF